MISRKSNYISSTTLWLRVLLFHFFVIILTESKVSKDVIVGRMSREIETQSDRKSHLTFRTDVEDLITNSANIIVPSERMEMKSEFEIVHRRRVKRSPYPPGFVIWSAPSEPLPCHCSPGHRKCRCLKLLERIASRSRRTVFKRNNKTK